MAWRRENSRLFPFPGGDVTKVTVCFQKVKREDGSSFPLAAASFC